ncbi:MAG: DUF424 family protein [Candidatus Methanofastidiosa archaeon]|jgi:hypothetical protein|nr:DUF424 family protein [Candidatus Methanofastidiosa archaeon]HOM95616.1 DUF424 family protein [Methanofastidiosum sp.]HPC81499.1 DUF424 family protein [Methanofastidiosum sp.]HRS24944.1 DUF424 family protein [Methanofastidiosum sp.]
MEFYYAIYRQGHELLVAVCDDNTLEGTFHCAEKGIKLDVKKAFYGKNLGQKEDILPHMKEATILNLVGEKIIEIALDEGLINKECIMVIGDTLHAQRVKM